MEFEAPQNCRYSSDNEIMQRPTHHLHVKTNSESISPKRAFLRSHSQQLHFDSEPSKPVVSKGKNLFSQMDQCRDIQFKSTFHQTSFPWRQIMDVDDDIHEELLLDPLMENYDHHSKKTNADMEVGLLPETKFDFDSFFTPHLVESPPCTRGIESHLTDDELMMLLQC
jgi:hypothetical protein